MRPESAKLLRDMQEAADAIFGYTDGKQLNDFLEDRALRDAVHWNFLIIGEALNQLRRIDVPAADHLSESPRIIGFRNQLIHGYAVIQPEITWSIVVSKLPVLRRELSEMLAGSAPGTPNAGSG